MAKKKAPSKKQLAARKKFVAMVRKKSKAKKAAAKKKVKIGDTIVRIPSKTRKNKNVVMQRNKKGMFANIGSLNKQPAAIDLNKVGNELLALEFTINNLKAKKKLAKLKADKTYFTNKIKILNAQFKALKIYLNTRAKFI